MKRFELSCRVFLHSLLVYIVFTLPALFIPFVFMVSLFIAFLYGLIAVTVFWFCFNGLYRINIQIRAAYQFLLIAVMVAVTFAFQVFSWTKNLVFPHFWAPGESAWNSGIFLLFPLLAIIAGWIGVYRSRKRILKQFLTRHYA